MIILLAVLELIFVFGDCLETDQACIAFQDGAARWLPVIVAVFYGIGLGVWLQRWVLGRKR